jgi:hypothetical protein
MCIEGGPPDSCAVEQILNGNGVEALLEQELSIGVNPAADINASGVR